MLPAGAAAAEGHFSLIMRSGPHMTVTVTVIVSVTVTVSGNEFRWKSDGGSYVCDCIGIMMWTTSMSRECSLERVVEKRSGGCAQWPIF